MIKNSFASQVFEEYTLWDINCVLQIPGKRAIGPGGWGLLRGQSIGASYALAVEWAQWIGPVWIGPRWIGPGCGFDPGGTKQLVIVMKLIISHS